VPDPLISRVGCGGALARDIGRVTGPRPSTAHRAARSVVAPVTRPGDDRATGRYARRCRWRLESIKGVFGNAEVEHNAV
jgi:hypothetical protein